jgi:hypothetical protein
VLFSFVPDENQAAELCTMILWNGGKGKKGNKEERTKRKKTTRK